MCQIFSNSGPSPACFRVIVHPRAQVGGEVNDILIHIPAEQKISCSVTERDRHFILKIHVKLVNSSIIFSVEINKSM